MAMTKKEKLKMYTYMGKMDSIMKEVQDRIDSLKETYQELYEKKMSGEDKSNEIMIALHRRNEMEEFQVKLNAIVQEIKDPNPLLTIGDILKLGRPGEVYEAECDMEAWNGTQIQVQQIGNTDDTTLFYIKPPNVKTANSNVGDIVKLSGIAVRSKWKYIGVRENVVYSPKNRLNNVVIHLSWMISASSTDSQLAGRDVRTMRKKKEELAIAFQDKLKVLGEQSDQLLILSGDKTEYHFHIEKLTKHIQVFIREIHFLSDDDFVERCECIISLLFYMYRKWWNMSGWHPNLRINLTDEDMLMIATPFMEGSVSL